MGILTHLKVRKYGKSRILAFKMCGIHSNPKEIERFSIGGKPLIML